MTWLSAQSFIYRLLVSSKIPIVVYPRVSSLFPHFLSEAPPGGSEKSDETYDLGANLLNYPDHRNFMQSLQIHLSFAFDDSLRLSKKVHNLRMRHSYT